MPKKEEKKSVPAHNPSEEERKIFTRVNERISQLKSARQQIINPDEAKSIEALWRDCEKLYPPHRYYSTALDAWQSKNSQPNPYSKVMTGYALLVANNPEVALRASSDEYEGKTNLIKALYQRSWKIGLCKEQLKLFVFNLAKYGFAVGRTYPRKKTRIIKDITFEDPVTGEQKYTEKEVDYPNETWFENQNIWNAWIDDMAIPGDPWSVRDWCWRQVVTVETAKGMFPEKKFKNAKYIKSSGNTLPDTSGFSSHDQKQFTSKDLVEIFYYENQESDEFDILIPGLQLLLTPAISPLPYKHKRLSCTFTHWTPRNAISIYGIGIIESLREDQETLDRVRNMSLDQLVLSIYQMFFHGPSVNFGEGKLRTAPGKLVQVTNPNDVKPVQFSPPSNATVQWLEMLDKSMDESTGITKSLSGQFIGKTAFEAQQNKEAGLRKLKIPMSNIEYALTLEARNHIDLIQQVLATPQDVMRMIGKKKVDEYFAEAEKYPEFYYSLGGATPEEEAQGIEPKTPARLFRQREVRLNLEQDQTKGFVESKTTNSFNISEDMIRWEGEIEIQPQSTIVKTVEVEQQMALDMFNVIAKLPTTALAKAEKWLLRKYEIDPDLLMPTEEEMAAKRKMDEMAMQQPAMPLPAENGNPPEQTPVVPRSETEPTQQTPAGQLIANSSFQ